MVWLDHPRWSEMIVISWQGKRTWCPQEKALYKCKTVIFILVNEQISHPGVKTRILVYLTTVSNNPVTTTRLRGFCSLKIKYMHKVPNGHIICTKLWQLTGVKRMTSQAASQPAIGTRRSLGHCITPVRPNKKRETSVKLWHTSVYWGYQVNTDLMMIQNFDLSHHVDVISLTMFWFITPCCKAPVFCTNIFYYTMFVQ